MLNLLSPILHQSQHVIIRSTEGRPHILHLLVQVSIMSPSGTLVHLTLFCCEAVASQHPSNLMEFCVSKLCLRAKRRRGGIKLNLNACDNKRKID